MPTKTLSFLLLLLMAPAGLLAKPYPIHPSLKAVGLTGKTYYVSPKGNDSHPGTDVEKPLLTLQKAANRLEPGDTLLIRGGIYKSQGTGNDMIRLKRSGTAQNWIRIANYPNEKPELHASPRNGIILPATKYVLIEGLTLYGGSDQLDSKKAIEWGKAYQGKDRSNNQYSNTGIQARNRDQDFPHHLIIRNNKVSHFSGAGIGLTRADYVLVEDNTTTRNALYSPWASSGISFYAGRNFDDQTTSYRKVIRRNISDHNENRVPFWLSGQYSDGNGIIIDAYVVPQKNVIDDGYTDPYSGRILIENNIAYRNGGRGVNLYKVDNVDVFHNTFYQNALHPNIKGELELGQATHCRVLNNIFVETEGKLSIREWRPDELKEEEVYVIDHNLNTKGAESSDANLGPNHVTADPAFIDAAAGNFKLKAESAARLSGSPDYRAATDISGNKRTAEGQPDLGAHANSPEGE